MTQAPSPGRDLPPGGYDALVLTGGGIHAAAFHFAALACLEDWVPGFDAGALPVYLGSSAGATVAALVGGGLPVRRIHRGIVEGDDYFPVRREHFFPGSRTAFLRPLLALASRSVAEALRAWRPRGRRQEPPPLAPGLFSIEPYEEFLAEYMAARGLPLRFDGLRRRVLVPGFDLDEARRVVFGRGPWRDVPVPRAVAASSAIPLVYRPVEVDGHWIVDGDTGGNNHLDLLLAEGCRRFLVVHAVAPHGCLANRRRRRSIIDLALLRIEHRMLENEYRVILLQRFTQHVPRVVNRGGRKDPDAWNVRIPPLEAMRVLSGQATASARGHSDNKRDAELTSRLPVAELPAEPSITPASDSES